MPGTARARWAKSGAFRSRRSYDRPDANVSPAVVAFSTHGSSEGICPVQEYPVDHSQVGAKHDCVRPSETRAIPFAASVRVFTTSSAYAVSSSDAPTSANKGGGGPRCDAVDELAIARPRPTAFARCR